MIDLTKLAAQGRAYSSVRPWTPEELEALVTLERERHVERTLAADWIRNGVMTLEAYDRAIEAGFKPKTQAEAAQAADATLKDHEFANTPAGDAKPLSKMKREELEVLAKELKLEFSEETSVKDLRDMIKEAQAEAGKE